jgi:hypothetical protein
MKLPLALVTAILLIACETQTNDNLNAITNQQSLTNKSLADKYDLVKSIDGNQIIGKWKLIASFMTIEMSDGSRGNTILPDGATTYDIRPKGVYYIDDYLDEGCKWELVENNTTFFDWGCDIDPEDELEDYDQMKIRIGNDTMEWIQKVDDEYIYQVLVKQ